MKKIMLKKEKILNACATMIFTVVAIFLVLGLIVSLKTSGIGSSEAAGWVQAIGSIAAILAALWVMNIQHRTREERDIRERMEKEDRLLRSIRTEVDVLFDMFNLTTNNVLANAHDGDLITMEYFAPANPFSVFDSQVSNLGIIRDDGVRRLIIVAYATFNGVLNVLDIHNRALRRSNDAAKSFSVPNQTGSTHQDQEILKFTSQQLITRYRQAEYLVQKILEQLPRTN